MKLRSLAAIVGVIASAIFGGAAAPAAYADASPTGSAVSGVEIPMIAVPHPAKAGEASPNIVIKASCGTAFLYPSNGRDHVHYDFGFEHLSIHPLWVRGHVGAQNLDNGEVAVNSYNGPSFSSTWEKQGNLYTYTGENLVTAYIYATGILYDCASSPGLAQGVYVY